MSKIDVLYYGCPFDLSGYGQVARNHLVNMNNTKGGVEMTLLINDIPPIPL